MAEEEYISVGQLGKPHGVRGAFRFKLFERIKSQSKIPKHFWLETGGAYLPWFIEKIEWASEVEGLIYFEEVKNPEAGRKFSGQSLFLSGTDYPKYIKKSEASFDYLLGFTALENNEPIGVIEEISNVSGQVLLRVNSGAKEVIIPLVEDFIVKVNKRKKEIIFDLPLGLLEL